MKKKGMKNHGGPVSFLAFKCHCARETQRLNLDLQALHEGSRLGAGNRCMIFMEEIPMVSTSFNRYS